MSEFTIKCAKTQCSSLGLIISVYNIHLKNPKSYCTPGNDDLSRLCITCTGYESRFIHFKLCFLEPKKNIDDTIPFCVTSEWTCYIESVMYCFIMYYALLSWLPKTTEVEAMFCNNWSTRILHLSVVGFDMFIHS